MVSAEELPAIRRDRRASNEAGVVGREENHGAGDLVGFAVAGT
jgi:hypothetical protein